MDSDKTTHAICEAMGKAHDDAAGVESTLMTMDELDAVPVFTEGGPADLAMALASARCQVKRLKAHLVSKGYGHAAIKRILRGEVVR